MIKAALSLALLSSPAYCEGWAKRGASMLLTDAAGEVVNEIGIVSSEEGGPGKIVVRETRGGVSKSGRFAWTLERVNTWNASRSKLLESKRLLRILGKGGEEIWTNVDADAADKLEPVIFSDDGEILLLTMQNKDGWRVAAKGYLGNTILELSSIPKLEDVRLTPDGRFALIRWTIPDKESTHTFWNIPAKQRKDIPSSELHLGRATLEPDGKVRSNAKVAFDLASLAPPATEAKP